MGACPGRQGLPFARSHPEHGLVERAGQHIGAAGRDREGCIAHRFGDPTRGCGDDRSPAGEHLLDEGDPERLDELGTRFRRQHVDHTTAHEVRLLRVVDVVEEPDAIGDAAGGGHVA
jgi:hypothetical protein